MGISFGKILSAAKWPIVGCLAFNLVLFGIQIFLNLLGFGAGAVAGSGVGAIASIINFLLSWGFMGLAIVGTFIIIIYGGFNAAKKGLDMISCGLVGAFTYGLTDPIMSILRIISGVVLGLGAGVAGGDATMGIFGGALNFAFGLGMLFCGFGWFLGGLVLNFIFAAIAGLIGGAK